MTNPEFFEHSEQRMVLAPDVTLDQLIEKLSAGNIPLDEYGVGNAKTLQQLLSEIHEGEAVVSIGADGTVYREVSVLWADVLCELSDGRVYIIKEDRQELKDGRVKRREIDSSIGEKLKRSEQPDEAIHRAIAEELSIETIDAIYDIGYSERMFTPDAFPGLETAYKMYKYVTVIPESEFKPEGYVEYQEDKTNYYVWELLHQPHDEN